MYIRISKRFTKAKIAYAILLSLYTMVISVLLWNFSVFLCGIFFSFVMLTVIDVLFPENKESIYKWATYSWMIGMTICLIIYYCYLICNGEPYFMSDDLLYDKYWSNLCIDNGYYTIGEMTKNEEFANHNSVGYVLVIVYLKRILKLVGGYHTLVPRILNITLLNITALVSIRIAKVCWEVNENEGKRIFQWISLFPNCIYLCSHIYRDMLVTFLVVLLFYIWLEFKKKNILQQSIIIIVTLFIISITYFIREFIVLIMIIIVFLNFLDFNRKRHTKSFTSTSKRMMKYIFCIIIFIGLCIVFNDKFEFILHEMYGYSVRWSTIYSQGSRFYATLADLGSNFVISSVLKCVYYILTPMNGQLFNPFIWTSSLDMVLSIITVGTFVSLYLLPYVIRRIAKLDNVAITFLMIYVVTATTTTGFRHILLCYPFFFMLGVTGKSDVSAATRNSNKIFVTWMICIFVLVYYIVRIGSLLK